MMPSFQPPPRRHRPRGVEILHDDRDLYVVNKHPGVLTTSTRRGEAATAENAMSNYLRKGDARSRKHVFLVHRLDRETSGVLLFAKSFQAQQTLKDNWASTEKLYLAAVRGRLKERCGIFASYLAEDDEMYVHSVADARRGKFSQTAYAVIGECGGVSLVKIRLLSGRKNQIRVQFAENGLPVLGDAKYGAGDSFRQRLCLHAKSIAFHHPHNGRRLFFDTPIPDVFRMIAKGFSEDDWNATDVPG